MYGNKGGNFWFCFDFFFEGYFQEDLLVFVEDVLIQDEEDVLVLVFWEGQEVFFVSLKIIIDCLMGYELDFFGQGK